MIISVFIVSNMKFKTKKYIHYVRSKVICWTKITAQVQDNFLSKIKQSYKIFIMQMHSVSSKIIILKVFKPNQACYTSHILNTSFVSCYTGIFETEWGIKLNDTLKLIYLGLGLHQKRPQIVTTGNSLQEVICCDQRPVRPHCKKHVCETSVNANNFNLYIWGLSKWKPAMQWPHDLIMYKIP